MVECLTRDRGFEHHRRHCVVSLSKNLNPSLVLVQPRRARPFITERLLVGRKEPNQTNKTNSMSDKLLAEHHFDFLSLTGGCTDSSESTFD